MFLGHSLPLRSRPIDQESVQTGKRPTRSFLPLLDASSGSSGTYSGIVIIRIMKRAERIFAGCRREGVRRGARVNVADSEFGDGILSLWGRSIY